MRHLSVLAMLLSAPLFAAPTCDELNAGWQGGYHADFNVLWPKTAFSCPSGTAKVAKSIYDLRASTLSRDYYGWAKGIIRETTNDPECTHYAYFSGGRMTLCKQFFTTDDEGRVGTLVHEAAHGRPGDPAHVTCAHGAHAGQVGKCDAAFTPDFSRGSGYNFEFVYYADALETKKNMFLDRAVLKYWLKFDLYNKFNVISDTDRNYWVRRLELDPAR